MKSIVITLFIFIPMCVCAQKEKKERPFFRRHIIHLAPAFLYGSEPGFLAGAAYSYRFTPVFALTVTAQGGKGVQGPITRFFVESQFNIKGENRVQPVFLVGAHVGNSIARYEKDSKLHEYNATVGGLNTGVGIEILFAKKRCLVGTYVRGLATLGTTSIISFNLHFQPTIAYRI